MTHIKKNRETTHASLISCKSKMSAKLKKYTFQRDYMYDFHSAFQMLSRCPKLKIEIDKINIDVSLLYIYYIFDYKQK